MGAAETDAFKIPLFSTQMATSEEADHAAAEGSDEETPERRHVDVLLDISEEDFSKELEPHEYHCYSGWEEAVQGWARVAPLSCILLTQKRYRRPKHKESDDPTPSSVDPAAPDVDGSAGVAEHRCESGSGPRHSSKKSATLAVAALQRDASEWPVLGAMRKTMSSLLLEEKTEEEGTLGETPSQPHHLYSKYSVLENRPTKPQKHRPNSTVVPIKNFTFLPPIKSPHLNPQKASGQLCSGRKAPEGETIEENCFVFHKKSGTRGTRADPVGHPELPAYSAALTSKYHTCERNLHLFSGVRVAIPKRYQVPTSSKPDIVHRYSMGKGLTRALHSGTAAGAQARIRPKKTVCAVKLYEGCEINV